MLVLRNRLAFSGHALCSWLIWFSHRPFSRNEEKKQTRVAWPIFSSPLTKSTSRPLYHTSGVERVDLQIRSSCKVRCAVACCKQQNACCVFCTLWMMCDPATVCVCFFFHYCPLRSGIFISVIGLNQVLGRQAEDTC